MFGRIRASTSSLDTLEGSPSKILKDDTFSIYEATLMKLKLGARRDTSACTSSKETDEVINDSSVSLPCAEEMTLKADLNPASTSCSEIMLMDTESDGSSSPRVCDHVSPGNSEQRRQSNVSILHFFKLKDPEHAGVSSSGEPTTSTRNGSSESISSTSVESHYRSEVEGLQICKIVKCRIKDVFMTWKQRHEQLCKVIQIFIPSTASQLNSMQTIFC
ncbi:hypothetical protein E2542_SST19714 [Spatholobus suberectus]|nr:hypothetical protein E2542_SST19714 [Spatholobus suberectus]